jgi:dTDP-4-amino-4,6-dideoxygalactose transaminase
MGHIGCTSFFPSKNLGAYGDGGAIFTNDEALANRLSMIANHGQSKRYYHDIVGCNSRLDSIQAAVLKVKLKHLDRYNEARNRVAAFYDEAFRSLPSLATPFRAGYSTHVFHQYTMVLDGIDRDQLNRQLAEIGIPSMIYYPVPAHRQKMFDRSETGQAKLEVTDWLTQRVLSLPIHTEMDEEQMRFIAENVVDFCRKA